MTIQTAQDVETTLAVIEAGRQATHELLEQARVFVVMTNEDPQYRFGRVSQQYEIVEDEGEKFLKGGISIGGDQYGESFLPFKISFADLGSPEEFVLRRALVRKEAIRMGVVSGR